MAKLDKCASCADSTQSLRQCARCKTVSYCSTACQRAHWKTHKPSCHFKAVLPSQATETTPTDSLSVLRALHDPGTKQKLPDASSVLQRAFNIPELRLAIFSQLPASDLLRTQQDCRSWYLTCALELKLQQRLFLSPGPGELIKPSFKAGKPHQALHPYNSHQREALKMEQRMGGDGLHLITTSDGTQKELPAADVQALGVQIICNPFLVRLWPQNPENMTLIPVTFACNFPREHSWRRMQITSPPITSLSMNLWFTKRSGEGSQLLPSTCHVPTGVTLGQFADMLAAQPKKLEYHWMQPHGYASWLRSADATVSPPEGPDKENSGGYRGMYVNPSNGIAFPGAFGRNWRKPGR